MERVGAAIYDHIMRLPERSCLRQWRREILAEAQGQVLEIGSGTGVNLPLYPPHVSGLVAVEPSPHMARRIDVSSYTGGGAVKVEQCFVEDLGLESQSIDTAVCMLVLCTVPDPVSLLREVRRVLRPEGKLLFLEHVASEREGTLRLQHRIDPLWCRLAGGCRLIRDTAGAIEEAGFEIERIERDEMCWAPSFVRPTIRGVARVRALSS
jgi:ubiquinone/menaquinone biosynthesis C-methylase UbiE